MPRVISVGLGIPPYEVPQPIAQQYALEHFRGTIPHLDRMAQVFNHAQIDTRYFVVPQEWWLTGDHSLKKRNDLYIETAVMLGAQALTSALEQVGLTPDAIDNLLVVSSTGIAAPSIDALLMNCLHLRRNVRRTPIWGLGCAGGVAGLARASEVAMAYPDSVTALVMIETCGLTFQFDDLSKKNFIAVSLFGDGAAAALIVGDRRSEAGVEIVGSQSTLWPDSTRVMGWDLVDRGLDVVFGAQIPRYVVDLFRPEVEGFLAPHGLTIERVPHMIFHPGGAKVIEAYDKALTLPPTQLDASRAVLRRYGNMSSPTVFFVLDYIQRHQSPRSGDYGLMAALGPGFSAEQVLLRF